MQAKTWNHWEVDLRNVLAHPDLLSFLESRGELKGYQSPSGRLTYSKIATASDFGAFSDIVVNMTIFETAPSIARVLLKNHVVRDRFVIYTSLEKEDFEGFEEEMSEGLQDLIDAVRDAGRPLGGICTLENEQIDTSHGIAFVAWIVNDQFYFAFYDPLAYQRKRVRANGETYMASYNYAAMTFREERFDVDMQVEFLDLSKYCLRSTNVDEFHCPQYVMDAEYCFINSLYFLYKWVHLGKPTGNALEQVVHACYIMEPSALKRHQSMVYRVVMMSFILTALHTYFTRTQHKQRWPKEWIDRIEARERQWLTSFGFPLTPRNKNTYKK